MAWRVGVDSGGTFTDVCFFDEETGELVVNKVSSTPLDPSRAIVGGVAELLNGESEVAYFAHGSTIATNALIQKRGVKTGLITTEGFRDLLELGRQRRPHLYDLQVDKPEPLVSRDLRLEVRERVHFNGAVEQAPDEDEVRAAVRALREQGVQAIAICFLYSYLYPDHEQFVQRIVAEEMPEAFVSTSHEILPEFREYERLSTVVINSYIGPVMRTYLDNLGPALRELGIQVEPHINQSNGGIISFETAVRQPVRTVLSGPSSGVVGATYIGKLAGFDDLITVDMGGTSADVSLIEHATPRLTGETEVEGYPVKTPMIDINAVGAGGGSIAWIDSGGHLKVGPQSAGADPGPVCYGLGNDQPTVTDANVVLQTLNPEYLLGGRMPISASAARQAVQKLADQLGLSLHETARGIVQIVTANMARAIRVISVQRGHDPRDFTLVAFGGAGPLHGARLAQELEIPRLLIPEVPGLLSALGLLVTDLRADFALTRILAADTSSLEGINGAFEELQRRADRWFDVEEIAKDRRIVRWSIDMRYQGQNYELPVSVPVGRLTQASLKELSDRFAQVHDQNYGYSAPQEPVELVTFRLEAIGMVSKIELRPEEIGDPNAEHARIAERDVYFSERSGFVKCPVYERSRLQPGNQLQGPAIVEQFDATTLILPGQRAIVDPIRNLIIETQS